MGDIIPNSNPKNSGGGIGGDFFLRKVYLTETTRNMPRKNKHFSL